MSRQKYCTCTIVRSKALEYDAPNHAHADRNAAQRYRQMMLWIAGRSRAL